MSEQNSTETNKSNGTNSASGFGPVGYPSGNETPHGNAPDHIVKLVTQIGAGWAKYGLTLGRMALAQSARTLETTSELLGALAKKVETVAAAAEDEKSTKG